MSDDDLTHAPIPDVDRLARLSIGRRSDGTVEVYGPPTAVLSLARWLRRPTDGHVDAAGPTREATDESLVGIAVRLGADAVTLTVVEGVLVVAGSAEGFGPVAEAIEVVGVGALDLRYAPIERRTTLDGAGPVTVVVASAYPSDG